ncbi:MAG: autotransporter outer membrane beta-barrel domain-containing protein, partial [Verrucomicrobia bacterium]|nr:autotransporter outer membrane beta-barrel domain-containing protein [Verrucomicrobiota bacterium]
MQLNVAGPRSGQYDVLNIGGNASLNGTLRLQTIGYVPAAGDLLTVVSAGGAVSGRFAQFGNPFATRPDLNTINLIYGKNFVELQFLNLTAPVSPAVPVVPSIPVPPVVPPIVPLTVIETVNFASFALTPNQLAAANLLDEVQLNPKTANLFSFLYGEPVSNLAGDLEKISPDGLTSFYEISFSNANIQRLNIEGELDDLRGGSTGFSSNMRVNGVVTASEGKASVENQSSKNPVEQVLQPAPENRWGVWLTGFGDFVNVDGDSNARGYDFTTGGFSLGVDYRITDQFAIGAFGEYAHTWTSLAPSGNIDVDSGRGGIYATWYTQGFYLDGAIWGGHDVYSSDRATLGGTVSGGTGGTEFGTFGSGGYDFHFGHLTIGPIASIQYTNVKISNFGENGSLAALQFPSQSADSLRTDFGFRAFYPWQIGKVVLEPCLSAAWEHEYTYSALPITAGFAGIPGPSATFLGPSEGHDSAIVSAGLSVSWTPTIATYVNYDGQLGRNRYDSNAVT